MSYTGYTVEEIEQAILDTLKADPTLIDYVRTFDYLLWERADEMERQVKNYPALLVAYMGGSDEGSVYSVLDHAGRFVVCCCARNLRGPTAAAHGSEQGEIGVYDLLNDVLSCLQFSELGLEIISCQSVRIIPLAATASLAIFGREFEVRWRLSQS